MSMEQHPLKSNSLKIFKTSTYFKNINIKDLTTNKYLTITKTIIGNTLNIQTTFTKNVNTYSEIISLRIPKI